MKIRLKAQSRVLVLPGVVEVTKAEADRLFLLGIAEKVIEEQTAEEQPKEEPKEQPKEEPKEQPKEEPKPKKRTRKAKA